MKGQIKFFSDKVNLKESITTKPLLYEMLDLFKKKKMIKTMNSKMTNSRLSTTKPKKKSKTKLSKQVEQEQNHRNGDHMEDSQWGGNWGEWGKRYRD